MNFAMNAPGLHYSNTLLASKFKFETLNDLHALYTMVGLKGPKIEYELVMLSDDMKD